MNIYDDSQSITSEDVPYQTEIQRILKLAKETQEKLVFLSALQK